MKKKRLAIEVSERFHRMIKLWATKNETTISAYVLDAVTQKIAKEKE